jgi:hypothetical protein
MKNTITAAFISVVVLFTVGCATQKSTDKKAPTGPPDATIKFEGGQASYWVSGGGGTGFITHQGITRKFGATAAGVGGTGGMKMSAVGEVYNLKSLSDFPGVYTGVKSGLTLFKGKMHERLENKKGVVIYAESKTTGLASTTGAVTVTVSFK